MKRTTAKYDTRRIGGHFGQSRARRLTLALIGILVALGLALPGTAVSQELAAPASLASLLLVPDADGAHRSQTTDETLAAAVAQGNEPGLEPKNPFRKKSFDLFRTEHDIEIMRQEMRVRFRLRPKKRETMSVELKF